MICIISASHDEAQRWADTYHLENCEWFYPSDFDDLLERCNFHVIVASDSLYNINPAYFERFLHVAKARGRINRI